MFSLLSFKYSHPVSAYNLEMDIGFLTKLKSIGIQGPLLSWIKQYLLDRKQRVVINGCCSDWRNVCAGGPQGSILGVSVLYY
jgi:hypothetical protein